jgi:regulator of sigma E protease
VSLLIAILGLAVLIFVHEAGHFVAARLVGMSPSRFYIGFPPAIAKFRRKGTEYGIGAIPLGGYVKIPGMHRPAPSDLDVHFAPALDEAPELTSQVERLRRLLTKGEMDQARPAVDELEWEVDHASLSQGARRSAERGVREVQEALTDSAYWRQPVLKRVLVIFAGPATNVLFAVVLFAALFMAGGGKATRKVDEVVPNLPAARAGLHSGDILIGINGRRMTPTEIRSAITGSHGRPLLVTVERQGVPKDIGPVRPTKESGVYRLGFAFKGARLGAPAAFWRSIKLTGLVTKQIGVSLGNLVHGKGRKDIASPVGIVQGSSSALHQSFQSYLWVLGLISLSLALLNLLPLLPLDGGHIVFSLIEGVRGRAVGREIYERVSAVGIALVVLLFFVGLSNDISRIGG